MRKFSTELRAANSITDSKALLAAREHYRMSLL